MTQITYKDGGKWCQGIVRDTQKVERHPMGGIQLWRAGTTIIGIERIKENGELCGVTAWFDARDLEVKND